MLLRKSRYSVLKKCAVGFKIQLHSNATAKVSLSSPFRVYDNLKLGGNKTVKNQELPVNIRYM